MATTKANRKQIWVSEYTRKDGTKVEGYYRNVSYFSQGVLTKNQLNTVVDKMKEYRYDNKKRIRKNARDFKKQYPRKDELDRLTAVKTLKSINSWNKGKYLKHNASVLNKKYTYNRVKW